MACDQRRGDKKNGSNDVGTAKPSYCPGVPGSECADQVMIGRASVGGSLFLKVLATV